VYLPYPWQRLAEARKANVNEEPLTPGNREIGNGSVSCANSHSTTSAETEQHTDGKETGLPARRAAFQRAEGGGKRSDQSVLALAGHWLVLCHAEIPSPRSRFPQAVGPCLIGPFARIDAQGAGGRGPGSFLAQSGEHLAFGCGRRGGCTDQDCSWESRGRKAKSSSRAGKVNASREHEQGIKGTMPATPWHGIAWAHSPYETEQILTRHRSVGPFWRPNNSPEKFLCLELWSLAVQIASSFRLL
jgi:hypothetical protein